MWDNQYTQSVAECDERTISDNISDIEISIENLHDRLNHLGYSLSQAQDDKTLMTNSDYLESVAAEIGDTTAALEQSQIRVLEAVHMCPINSQEGQKLRNHSSYIDEAMVKSMILLKSFEYLQARLINNDMCLFIYKLWVLASPILAMLMEQLVKFV